MKIHSFDISKQYQNTLIWITSLFAISFLLIITLVWAAAKTIDAEDIKYTQESIQNTVERAQIQLLSQVKNYAIENEAYTQWVSLPQPNPGWIASNFSNNLYSGLSVGWAIVRDDQQHLIFSSYEGKANSLPPNFSEIEKVVLSIPALSTRLRVINDELWAFASHPIMQENSSSLVQDQHHSFIFAQRLAPLLSERIRAHTKIEDFYLWQEPIAVLHSYPIRDHRGITQAYLSWAPANPGTKLLLQLLPWVFLMLLFLGGATLWLIRRISSQGKQSLQEMEEFAETRKALSDQQNSIQKLRQRFQEQPDQHAFLKELIIEGEQLIHSEITSIWLVDEDEKYVICEASNSSMSGEQLPVSVIEYCLSQLQEKPVITFNLTLELTQQSPNNAKAILDFFADYHVQSVAMAAIYLGGTLRGVLTFGSLHYKSWSDAEKSACSALAGVIAQYAEAFQRRTVEEDFYQKTCFDDVTGLPRIAYIHKHFSSQLKSSHGYMAIFRVQGLHIINELHGLKAGNEAFQQLAEFMLKLVSSQNKGAILVRLPANRLALFSEDDRENTLQFINHLIHTVNDKSWLVNRKNYSLQLQVGLACYPEDGSDIETLQHRARLALQHVRRSMSGINFAFYSSDVHLGLKERTSAIRELKTAIDKEQFELFLQPQFDLQGQVAGAEALIRWNHPAKGLLTPYHFIDLAEETELILPIGDWVLHKACSLLETLPISLSVNISVLQLKQDNFVDQLEALMKRYHVPPQKLILEVVESLLIEQEIKNKLVKIRALGVQLSLDDFGTGYSSLSYLHDLKFDELKVDRSFIQTLDAQDDAPLVRTIIAMAHTLNMRVVVEGVETEKQLEFVRQQEAELTQGFLLARPEPWDHFIARMNIPMLSIKS